jgi:glycosyltransferase involved in cell wall biosynthesis
MSRIAFLTRDWSGEEPNLVPAGCNFYRCYLPAIVCGQRAVVGIPVYDPIRGYGAKENSRTGVFGYNTVVLKLIMDRTTAPQMRLAKQNARQKFIVDIDDFYQGLTSANKAFLLSHPEHNKKSNRDFYEDVIAEADLITVSTPFLYDYYAEQYPNVKMVRNGVNMNMFNPRKHTDRKPVFGWTGSTEYRNNDLEQLREWLPDFLEEHDLTFHHAGYSDGAPTFAEITGIDPNRLTMSPLVDIVNYASGFKFDVGIVPLNNIPFNQAKSNIKGLEYAAAGIPFIASDMPEYRLLHEDGVGVLADTSEQWKAAATMYLKKATRMTDSQRALTIVKNNWSIEARAKEWREIFTAPQ